MSADITPESATQSDASSPTEGSRPDVSGLRSLLASEHDHVLTVLDDVRRTRLAVEQTATQKIRRTHDKLLEVSNTTQVAASDILDGLDRSMGIIDQLDECAEVEGERAVRATTLRGTLRDELFQLMGAMQFQDITSQQLAHAGSVLAEVETRLAQIAIALNPMIDPSNVPRLASETAAKAFDPDATMVNRAQRQAVADEILGVHAGRSHVA